MCCSSMNPFRSLAEVKDTPGFSVYRHADAAGLPVVKAPSGQEEKYGQGAEQCGKGKA